MNVLGSSHHVSLCEEKPEIQHEQGISANAYHASSGSYPRESSLIRSASVQG